MINTIIDILMYGILVVIGFLLAHLVLGIVIGLMFQL